MRGARFVVVALAAIIATLPACARDPQALKRKYVAAGDAYIAQKKPREATIEYTLALRSDPKAGEVHFKLAQVYEALSELPHAISEYIRAADLLPDNAQAQLKAAAYLLRARQFEDAKTRARAALKVDPRNSEALVILGNALAGLENLDGRWRQTIGPLRSDPARSQTYLSRGRLQTMRGSRSEALAAFQQAVAVDKSPETHLALANFYWSIGQMDAAETSLKDALALNPDDVAVNQALAGVYLNAGRTDDAERHLLTTVRVANDAQSRLTLADYYLFSRRPDQALKVLAPLAEHPDTFAVGKTKMGIVELVTGHGEKAAALVEEVLAREPRNAPALALKVHILLTKHQINEALETSNAAVNADPSLLQAYFARARALRAKGDLEKARRALDEVVRRDSGAVEALLELSDLHLTRGEIDTAIQFARQAVAANPTYLSSRLAVVRALLVRKDDLPRASAEVKLLLAAYPNQPEPYVASGTVAMLSQDRSAARRAFERALEIQPQAIDALQQLVALDIQDKRPQDALQAVTGALKRAPDSPRVLFAAADTYRALGDAAKSEETLKKIIQVDPSNMNAYDALARLYLSQRRVSDARAIRAGGRGSRRVGGCHGTPSCATEANAAGWFGARRSTRGWARRAANNVDVRGRAKSRRGVTARLRGEFAAAEHARDHGHARVGVSQARSRGARRPAARAVRGTRPRQRALPLPSRHGVRAARRRAQGAGVAGTSPQAAARFSWGGGREAHLGEPHLLVPFGCRGCIDLPPAAKSPIRGGGGRKSASGMCFRDRRYVTKAQTIDD